jgi:DNA mismatch repair protein MutL
MSNRIEFQDKRYSRPIQQLDRVLINKIAAGEVVERPASVVKELIENSFDAGAGTVDIVAKKAGTTYISITDNGCGIQSQQMKLAFSRHATSKIKDLEDLFAVHSFGFRGEALPSIASVSHLTLTSRHYTECEGTRIVIEGGKEIECRPISAPPGTKVEVSHLFFNTPARRKFLKSETTESRQIIRVAERMALSRPSVAVSLNLNERNIFRLHSDQPTADRMATLFGVENKSIVEYDVEMSGISYLVYLAHPDQARNDRTRICLFINGRSVTSSTIIHAVTAGYGEFLPGGRFPLAAIFITVDPRRLDVNVHPTKAEVRLSEERAIHDNLYRIVKKALRDWRMVPSVGQSQRYQPNSEYHGPASEQTSFRPPSTGAPHSGSYPKYNAPGHQVGGQPSFPAPPDVYAPPACDNTKPVEEVSTTSRPAPDTISENDIVYLGKTGRQYLLVTIGGELYIVDQHAAHERVLYEDALEQVERESATAQKLLFPENVELSSEEFLTYESSREVLSKLGFDTGPFGKNAIIINGMPPVFGDKNPANILRKLLDDIAHLNKAGGELIKSVAQSLACRAAVMAGDRLSPEEVLSLIIKMFSKNNPYCCPHGRPTFIKISQEELDGRFGRT